MKTNVLRGKIAENGMNIGEFCNAANFTRSTFDRKMNGQSEFDRDEICRIISVLNLQPEEIRDIFFAEGVS